MDTELLQHYLSDESRRGAPVETGFSGAAGGAPCGDLVRISIAIETGAINAVSFQAEGCATVRAAAAATAEAADGVGVFEAALIGVDEVAEMIGGVSSQGRHAVELAADALARALSAAAGSSNELDSRRPPASGCWWRSAAASTRRWRRCASASAARRWSR